MKQTEALEILKMGHNVFLTGAAGSGKTYVLNQYLDYLRKHHVDVGITASTGIAATHMNGVTIHSWSGLGIRDSITEKEVEELYEKAYLKRRITNTDVLVIDEISMLNAGQLDAVDAICRRFKESSQPFGGIQVVLSGDFFQLPPVSQGDVTVGFVTESNAWHALDINVCYLEEQHRHEDDDLIGILNQIRTNTVTEDVWELLRTCYKRSFHEGMIPTKLYTHNVDVDMINTKELEALDEEARTYEMYGDGSKGLVTSLKKSCLAPETLELKVGATVMFVKNNFEVGYVNGTLGTVIDFDASGLPVVETFSGDEIVASHESWSITEGGEELAAISQVPLRLAWAITVHKSQGMSLDASVMDLSKSFVAGMGYVALSRVRSLKGLCLMGLNETALQVNPYVLDLDLKLQEASEHVSEQLAELNDEEKEAQKRNFLNIIAPDKDEKGKQVKKQKEKRIPTIEKTKLLVEEKKSLKEIAKERGIKTQTIIGHLEQLHTKYPELDMEYLKPEKKVFEEIKEAFEKSGDTKLKPARDMLGKKYSYDVIGIVRLFL